MPARTVTGHALQRTLLDRAAAAAKEAGITPVVALVRVDSDDPMSPVNFRLHQRVLANAGIAVRPCELPQETTEGELLGLISGLNEDDAVDVVQLLLPLPDHLDFRAALAAVAPEKEAEGLHLDHVMRLNPLSSLPPTRVPVVPTAVLHLLGEIGFTAEDFTAVVLTDPALTETNPVAKMVARIAAFSALPPEASGTAVPVTHPRAREISASADLLVVSLQSAHVVTDEWVKPGAVVIDFNPVFRGFRPSRRDPQRQVPDLTGGVEVASVEKVAGVLVPAPGGVGPVMLGALAEQMVTAALQRRAAAG